MPGIICKTLFNKVDVFFSVHSYFSDTMYLHTMRTMNYYNTDEDDEKDSDFVPNTVKTAKVGTRKSPRLQTRTTF